MSKDAILTILNSEFNRSIDDTIINRLSESLFCDNIFHEGFWKNIDTYSINDISKFKKVEDLSHPNLIQVLVALFHKNEIYYDTIEEIIVKCLDNSDSEYYYIGIWCISKLLGIFNFKISTISKFLNIYFKNNNVIFETLFQSVLVDIFYYHYANIDYEDFRKTLIHHIFDNLNSKIYLLINLLENKLLKKSCDCNDFEHHLRNLDISLYMCLPELIYCYSMCSNTNITFELEIIKSLELLNVKQVKAICTKIMYKMNGYIIDIVSKENIVGEYLWNKCIENAMEMDDNFVKSFLSIKQLNLSLVPERLFMKFFNGNQFNYFNNLIFGKFSINFTCCYFIENDFKNIFDKKEQILIQRLFDGIYNEFIDDLFLETINGKENCIKHVYDKILDSYKSSIIENKNLDNINYYLDIISDCLYNEKVNASNKVKLLFNEIELLIIIQNSIVQRYFNSYHLELLSTKSIRLSKEIMMMSLGMNKIFQPRKSLSAIIELSNSIITVPDFYDDILSENLYYCLLTCCIIEKDIDLIGCTINFLLALANHNITMNIKELFVILPYYNDLFMDIGDEKTILSIESVLFASLPLFKFRKCNLSMKSIQQTFQTLMLDGERKNDLLNSLTFCTDYCEDCRENIKELIDDIVLSCKPLDCFGD